MSRRLVYFVLIFLLLCHFPFLTADPDSIVDWATRGPWTDEGCYAAQLRNYLHQGIFNVEENVTFVKGPLFNVIQLPFFWLFGPKLVVARLIVLLFAFFVFFLFSRLIGLELFTFLLLVTTLTQFQLFHSAE